MKQLTRRDFLAISGAAALANLQDVPAVAAPASGPSIYWTASRLGALRTVEDVRIAVRSGEPARAYAEIRRLFDLDLNSLPLTPSTPIDGRDPASVTNNAPDFVVTNAAGQRMLRGAFTVVIEDDPALRQVALEQMEVLFDEDVWEGWIDKAHLRFGHPADLRTGMLSEAVGLTYDWLRPYLTENERQFIVEGLDRCGIQPFLRSMEQKAWWLNDLNNWLTTIVGGLGIAGMALREDHPDSGFLVSYATTRMSEYLSIYGPSGEFNESIHYANATLRPVSFFQAHRYWSRGGDNRLSQSPFPETCLWQLYLTLPPGRVVAFGDSRPDARPWTKHIAAVAAATRDPVLQWFYERYRQRDGDPIALLWHDNTLKSASPEGRLPKGRSFPAHGGCIISRSDWDADAAACIAYGKSGREENHEHNDAGQLCIDANGERLVIDIGSPKPSYPADFFDSARYKYYNASVVGHNVLMFDGRELRYPDRERGSPIGTMATERSGRIVGSEFDDERGAMWVIDLTPAYADVTSVHRSVVHLLPGVVAVLDWADLPTTSSISLRWHTIVEPVLEPDGRFSVSTDSSKLHGRVVARNTEGTLRPRQHRYKEPYNRGRGGMLLEQHHEPYLEILANASRCRFLTLFAVARSDAELSEWKEEEGGWVVETPDGNVAVTLVDRELRVTNRDDGRTIVAETI